jgi:hypothetical protein
MLVRGPRRIYKMVSSGFLRKTNATTWAKLTYAMSKRIPENFFEFQKFFFIYNLNQQSEFTFYKLMLWLLQCLDGESSSGESPEVSKRIHRIVYSGQLRKRDLT